MRHLVKKLYLHGNLFWISTELANIFLNPPKSLALCIIEFQKIVSHDSSQTHDRAGQDCQSLHLLLLDLQGNPTRKRLGLLECRYAKYNQLENVPVIHTNINDRRVKCDGAPYNDTTVVPIGW